jgi:hypothetical protein
MKKVVNFLADEIKKRDWSDEQIKGLKMALFPKSSEFEPAYKNWLQRHPEQKDVKPMSEAELDELANMGL